MRDPETTGSGADQGGNSAESSESGGDTATTEGAPDYPDVGTTSSKSGVPGGGQNWQASIEHQQVHVTDEEEPTENVAAQDQQPAAPQGEGQFHDKEPAPDNWYPDLGTTAVREDQGDIEKA